MWDAELRMQPDVFLDTKKEKLKMEVCDSHNILHHFNDINTQTGMTLDGRVGKLDLVYMCRNIN